MSLQKISGISALAVGILGIPFLHFAAVDLEGKQPASEYLAHANSHYLTTALAGGATLLLAVALVVHLVSMRYLGASRPMLADVATAVAGFAAIGLVLGGASAIMAAYGAHEEFPYEAVRPMGLLAENLFAILIPSLAATALLVAVLGLRDGTLPRWLAIAGAVFFVVLTLLGVLLPGSAAILALLWLVISGAGLLLAPDLLRVRAPQTPVAL